MDENKLMLAKQVYADLCNAVEKRNWNFTKNDENLGISFRVSGDDIAMDFVLYIDAERQLIRLLSQMPFNMSESNRIEGAVAVCAASFAMVHGNFVYNIGDGSIVYRIVQSYRESRIGDGLFYYLISCACAMVDKYNDKFLALDKGMIGISDFISQE